jgi:hypothetical protein
MKKSTFVVLTLTLTLIGFGGLAVAGNAAPKRSALWLKNVGDVPARIEIQASRTNKGERLKLRAGELTVREAAGTARVQTAAKSEVFVLRAPAGLDARGMEFEVRPEAQIKRTPEGAQIDLVRPEWVVELLSTTAIEGATLRAGQVTRARVTLTEAAEVGAQLDAAIAFFGPASVRLRLVDADGRALTSLTATAPRALRWRMPLGELTAEALAGGTQLEIQVLRGKVVTAVGLTPVGSERRLVRPVVTAIKSGGTGYFNYAINWSTTPDLYYYIVGGPANTCGELNAYRNGSWQTPTPGWVCTDVNGNATKGPWSWASQPSDETANPVYIEWPGGSTTSNSEHVWDKTCPYATFSPSPSGAPPTTWQGNATDTQWGACFHGAWTEVASSFYDSNTGKYWNTGSGTYSGTPGNGAVVYGTFSGAPSCSISWSTSFPPASAHVSGHHYYWTTCVSDGGCSSCVNYDFIY